MIINYEYNRNKTHANGRIDREGWIDKLVLGKLR